MSATSAFTDEQKAAAIQAAVKSGRAAVAEKLGVSPGTISKWAADAGVNLTTAQSASPPKAPKKKRRRKSKANGKANGHAEPATEAGPTSLRAQIESTHAQLTASLESVKALRAAFRQVFG